MMEYESARTLHFPCRFGELTLWSPQRRLWVYRGGLRNTTLEATLVERFRARRAEFEGALLHDIRVDAERRRLRWRSGLIRYVPQSAQRYLIDLSGTFEEYMAGFGSKTRSTLRRKVRRLAREDGGTLDFREYRSASGLSQFFPLAREVSSRSYQEIMLDAGLPDDEAFRKELLDEGERDSARGYILFFQGQPVAYLYCPIRDGVARYEFVGYNQDMRSFSPGTVLLLQVLEELFQDREIHTFDFTDGGGEESHKAHFSTDSVSCGNVYYLKPSLSNLAIVAAQMSSHSISNSVSRALATLGVKAQAKKALRRLRGI